MDQKISFPGRVLQPLKDFLVKKEKKLEERKKELDQEDPFTDTERITNNAAVDADAAEQSGHDRISALKFEVDKGLINIRKTLTRIRLGKYGLCESCHKMIDTDRLAVDPTTSFCVSCAAKKTEGAENGEQTGL